MAEVVALDIDDVVVRHVEGFVRWSNAMYGTQLTPDDYSEAWHELWGIHPDEVEARKKLFFVDDIIGEFEIIEGAAEGIIELSDFGSIVGVTSRRESLRSVTESMLELIAPGAVSDVKFATYFRGGEKITRTKPEICSSIGATSLVDDQLKHCLGVAEIGIHAYLFGNYPWNQSDNLPPSVVRTPGWSEVLEHFRAK